MGDEEKRRIGLQVPNAELRVSMVECRLQDQGLGRWALDPVLDDGFHGCVNENDAFSSGHELTINVLDQGVDLIRPSLMPTYPMSAEMGKTVIDGTAHR